MGGHRTSLVFSAVGYGLALALIATAAWGAWELVQLGREWADIVPAGWDCDGASRTPVGTWGDPCAALVDAQWRAYGMASVYTACAVVGAGLGGLVYSGRLADGLVRVLACVGTLLAWGCSMTALWRLTLVDNPVFELLDDEMVLRLIVRERPLVVAVVGMVVVAVFVLPRRPEVDSAGIGEPDRATPGPGN